MFSPFLGAWQTPACPALGKGHVGTFTWRPYLSTVQGLAGQEHPVRDDVQSPAC